MLSTAGLRLMARGKTTIVTNLGNERGGGES